jgi:hypothetical protein
MKNQLTIEGIKKIFIDEINCANCKKHIDLNKDNYFYKNKQYYCSKCKKQ